MTKKHYQKPAIEVMEADMEQQILAGSVKSVWTTGLDDDLILPDNEEPKSGSVWEEVGNCLYH